MLLFISHASLKSAAGGLPILSNLISTRQSSFYGNPCRPYIYSLGANNTLLLGRLTNSRCFQYQRLVPALPTDSAFLCKYLFIEITADSSQWHWRLSVNTGQLLRAPINQYHSMKWRQRGTSARLSNNWFIRRALFRYFTGQLRAQITKEEYLLFHQCVDEQGIHRGDTQNVWRSTVYEQYTPQDG